VGWAVEEISPEMISAIIISALLLFLALLLWGLIRDGRIEADDPFLSSANSGIDIGTLELLLSAEENNYLRRSLPSREFCFFKRQRVVLARKYLRAMNRDVKRLIRIAGTVKSSNDPDLVHAADDLIARALRIRTNLPLVYLCLLMEWVFPELALPIPIRIIFYREMVERFRFIQKRTNLETATVS
jgi:hypothetical protein